MYVSGIQGRFPESPQAISEEIPYPLGPVSTWANSVLPQIVLHPHWGPFSSFLKKAVHTQHFVILQNFLETTGCLGGQLQQHATFCHHRAASFPLSPFHSFLQLTEPPSQEENQLFSLAFARESAFIFYGWRLIWGHLTFQTKELLNRYFVNIYTLLSQEKFRYKNFSASCYIFPQSKWEGSVTNFLRDA